MHLNFVEDTGSKFLPLTLMSGGLFFITHLAIFARMSIPIKKALAIIFISFGLSSSFVVAQGVTQNTSAPTDTIYATTQPVGGFRLFAYKLQAALSQADTVGRKTRMRVNNIGFIVSKTGTIDSTWIIFRPRPIHNEIMKVLRASRWVPALQEGQPVVSVQDMDIEIYLTKAALKRHRSWKSLTERILSPWSH
jgi:hypothetical protein